jgi:hypothetical protein
MKTFIKTLILILSAGLVMDLLYFDYSHLLSKENFGTIISILLLVPVIISLMLTYRSNYRK